MVAAAVVVVVELGVRVETPLPQCVLTEQGELTQADLIYDRSLAPIPPVPETPQPNTIALLINSIYPWKSGFVCANLSKPARVGQDIDMVGQRMLPL